MGQSEKIQFTSFKANPDISIYFSHLKIICQCFNNLDCDSNRTNSEKDVFFQKINYSSAMARTKLGTAGLKPYFKGSIPHLNSSH